MWCQSSKRTKRRICETTGFTLVPGKVIYQILMEDPGIWKTEKWLGTFSMAGPKARHTFYNEIVKIVISVQITEISWCHRLDFCLFIHTLIVCRWPNIVHVPDMLNINWGKITGLPSSKSRGQCFEILQVLIDIPLRPILSWCVFVSVMTWKLRWSTLKTNSNWRNNQLA